MDLIKLRQNEEIPIVVMTKFDVDSFVKGYQEVFRHQKLVKFYQLKENQQTSG